MRSLSEAGGRALARLALDPLLHALVIAGAVRLGHGPLLAALDRLIDLVAARAAL